VNVIVPASGTGATRLLSVAVSVSVPPTTTLAGVAAAADRNLLPPTDRSARAPHQPPPSPLRIAAWAAATRATGTRKGEHDT
jgi:hypothetical protein